MISGRTATTTLRRAAAAEAGGGGEGGRGGRGRRTTSCSNSNRRSIASGRRIVIFWLITLNIFCTEVLCSGLFQLKLNSFHNGKGTDVLGNCCSGGTTTVEAEPCRRPCRTFFWVCLRHFQNKIPTHNVDCTYGNATTGVLGQNSFNASITDTKYLVNLPFDFSWPGSFSLIIEAWHDLTDRGPYKGSNRTLISRLAIKRMLDVGQDWRPDVYLNSLTRLTFQYRAVCSENYYGPGCSEMCIPRDDKFGHFTCSQNASKVCLPGWIGEYCETAICLEGCNATNGFCDKPFECKCRLGWQGSFCDKCIPYPGCHYGGCNDRWQCNCNDGWGGLFCNQDLNFCTNNRPCMNGATCKNTGEGSYTCDCPVGFTGTNCELEIFNCHRLHCHHNGTCQQQVGGQYKCDCPEGYSGRRCEFSAKSCSDNPCKNHGTCWSVNSEQIGYRCECQKGFTGSNCEIETDECVSIPCINGGRCIDEHGRFRCVCPSGYTGDRCETDLNDCLRNPCLNGASCIDGINHFLCRCLAGFTGDLCQDNVDDCLTHPCANGGTCYDRNNGFQCHCAPGFSGRDCSLRIDECQSRPCVNGATCHDLLNAYRCVCLNGFTGVNCDRPIDPTPPSPSSSSTSFTPEVTNASSLYSSAPSDDKSPSPETEISDESSLRYLALVICLGVVLTLLALCGAAIVVVMLHRRRRLRSAARQTRLVTQQKMNNADVRSGFQSAKDLTTTTGRDDDSGLQQQQQQQQIQQQQQRYIDFATKEQMQMQRNINHTKNLKNVEKCPSRKPNTFCPWGDNNFTQDPLSSCPKKPVDVDKHLEEPESRKNNKTTERSSMWKQSDDLLSTQVPSDVGTGPVCFRRKDSTLLSEGTIATEV